MPTTRSYFITVFLLTWAITLPAALGMQGVIDLKLPGPLAWMGGLLPAIVAWFFARREGAAARAELKASTLRIRTGALWPVLALALPLAWAAAWIMVSAATKENFRMPGLSPDLAVFFVVWLVFAFGEEIGWRGYAMPRMLARSGPLAVALVLGLIWAVWHFPKMYAHYPVPDFGQSLVWVGQFTVQIVLAHVVMVWLFLRSGRSVPVVALFHAAFNTLATAIPTLAIEPVVTAAIGLSAALVVLGDRSLFLPPRQAPVRP